MSQTFESAATKRTPFRQLGEQLSHLWWVALVTGCLSIGLGLAVLATDWAVSALVVFTGLVFVIRGFALALSPEFAMTTSGEHVVAGVIGIVAGIVLIAWPDPSLLVLAFFVGAWLAVSGCFQIVEAFARREQLTHWLLTLGLGIVEALLGIWAMRRPEATLSLIITIIGLWSVITGVLYCMLAFEVRRDARALTEPIAVVDVRQVSDRLDRLARLRADGMLSESEYSRLKGMLLADAEAKADTQEKILPMG